MPPHTPRQAVIAAAEQARAAERRSDRHGRRRLHHRRRQGGATLPRQRHYARPRRLDALRPSVPTRPIEAANGAADQRAHDALGRRVQRHFRRHRRADPGEGVVPPSAHHSGARSFSTPPSPCTRRSGCSCLPASAPWITASKAFAQARRIRTPMRRRCAGCRLLTGGLPRVKADPTDLQARLDCQMGSWLSMGPLAAACRWARATASAMCWAPCSTFRTAIPRASCCRR